MTIFAVLMPTESPALIEEIKKVFPNDYLSLSSTQYLVSANGTTTDLCRKLRIYNPDNPNEVSGNAVVLSTTSYFGRAPVSVWDWMKAKLESPVNG